MSKEKKILKIISDFYPDNEKIISTNSPKDTLIKFLSEVETRYLQDDQSSFKYAIDDIIQKNYTKSSTGKVFFSAVSKYVPLEKLDELKNIKISLKDKNKDMSQTDMSLFKYKQSELSEIIKQEFRKSRSAEHPFLTDNLLFFILSNSREGDVLNTISTISTNINKYIEDFYFCIEYYDKDSKLDHLEFFPPKINSENAMINKNKEVFYNKIIFGPTGTGKSYLSNQYKEDLLIKDENFFRTTFYEDYSYYDFFGQYKPLVLRNTSQPITIPVYNEKNKTTQIPGHAITYQFVPGIFFKSLIKSLFLEQIGKQESVLLLIEEINRGNCSSIFGDIFQLLDRGDDGNSSYKLSLNDDLKRYLIDIKYDMSKNEYDYNPFSSTVANEDILCVLQSIIENDFIYIPSNLKIVATMNTSDQSLFPMDSAFKRRWNMEYSPINYKEPSLKHKTIENTNINWLDFLSIINNIIYEKTKSEDKQIGQWFIKTNNECIGESEIKNKLISYLYFDVFKHFPEVFKRKAYSQLINMNLVDIIELLKDNKESE